jgi:hypothetical protein
MTKRICPVCLATVPDDVTMIRAEVYRRVRRRTVSSREPVCLDCLPAGIGGTPTADGRPLAFAPSPRATEPVECVTCGLPVILSVDARRKIDTCSDRCRTRYYSDRARHDHAPATHRCEGCGEMMTGRADRRYCSSACRQRAYRQREALARRGIAREDASAVLTASRLTNDQFEDVLRQARTDDDLSADHLAQLAEEVLNQP